MKKRKRKQPKRDGWYSSKSYPHFDLPISFEGAKKYVLSEEKIATHDFYPFVAYTKKTRRYKGKEEGASNKLRPIKYASHLDGNIYSFYALNLGLLNEKRIASLGLDQCIIGYRSGKGSNINLSQQAVSEIKNRKNCVAIALDISGFYGHIDHKNLEREWCHTLDKQKLPKDHLAIFRSLTRWTCVDRDKLVARLKLPPNDLPLRLVENPSVLRGLRKEDKSKIKEEKIFETNKQDFGIPEGSPLSSLLSNIFMVPFDQTMQQLATKIDGCYKRYSDDILFICDEKHQRHVLERIDAALAERGPELKRNRDKDHISIFRFDKEKGRQVCDKAFQYLGFTFDGDHIRIRGQTLSKYHRRVKFGTRATKKTALSAQKKGGFPATFRKGLNSSLTHLGKEGFVGGYVRNAEKIMGDKAIRSQIKGSYERVSHELSTPLKKRKK